MSGQPLLVELVGVAGAGKTTLVQAMSQRNRKIQAVVPPCKVRYIPFLIGNALLWSPTYLRQYPHARWFTWRETKLMAYLKVWQPHLRRQALAHNTVTVLNPGSVYWLAALREFGPDITKTQLYGKWWNSMLDRWAALLDMVIWLEAPVKILLERVRARDDWHEAKEQPEHQALKCFARYRTCYEQVISAMTANGGPKVLRFRTDQVSPDEMAERVLAVLNLEDGQATLTRGAR